MIAKIEKGIEQHRAELGDAREGVRCAREADAAFVPRRRRRGHAPGRGGWQARNGAGGRSRRHELNTQAGPRAPAAVLRLLLLRAADAPPFVGRDDETLRPGRPALGLTRCRPEPHTSAETQYRGIAMRTARWLLLASLALLAATWAAVWSVAVLGPREDDLGLGVLVVLGVQAGHFFALVLAVTAVVLGAWTLRGAAGRTISGYLTVACAALLIGLSGWVLWWLFRSIAHVT